MVNVGKLLNALAFVSIEKSLQNLDGQDEQSAGYHLQKLEALRQTVQEGIRTAIAQRPIPEEMLTSSETRPYISNLNTFSALIDRLLIENAKLLHFQREQGRHDADSIATVQRIIMCLTHEIDVILEETFARGRYPYERELRTYAYLDDRKDVGNVNLLDRLLQCIEELAELCVQIGYYDRKKFELARMGSDAAQMAAAIIRVRKALERRAELKNILDTLLRRAVEEAGRV